MPNSILALLTIFGMALATYLTRISGWWLMSYVQPSPRVEAWLRQIPGAVLVAIVAPAVFATNVAQTLAALCTVIVAIYTKNVLISMIVGVAAVWLLRLIM
ncbi:MAG TPA: AzlD domain-containing protein [Ktedonobacteraceae bacterium]|jgi:uncharacterized membrane protein|nr:AzlD domain-containing protein [Ktedonobacteraceae bacterium]